MLRGQYYQLEGLATQLLLLECPLVVRQPPELRMALRAVVERALDIIDR